MTTTRNPKTHALRTSAAVGIAAAAVLTALPALAQAPAGIPGVVAPGVAPELVQEGFVFTEGPVGKPDGGLYFTDIRPNKVYELEPNGKITLIREQSTGANGLALTKDGDLLAAEGDGRRISKRSRDGTITTVTGVQVFDAKGQYLGTIKVPRQPANAAFGGPDKGVLYITAREGLYRLKMQSRGPDRVGK